MKNKSFFIMTFFKLDVLSTFVNFFKFFAAFNFYKQQDKKGSPLQVKGTKRSLPAKG